MRVAWRSSLACVLEVALGAVELHVVQAMRRATRAAVRLVLSRRPLGAASAGEARCVGLVAALLVALLVLTCLSSAMLASMPADARAESLGWRGATVRQQYFRSARQRVFGCRKELGTETGERSKWRDRGSGWRGTFYGATE
jgi:hypothetical protein